MCLFVLNFLKITLLPICQDFVNSPEASLAHPNRLSRKHPPKWRNHPKMQKFRTKKTKIQDKKNMYADISSSVVTLKKRSFSSEILTKYTDKISIQAKKMNCYFTMCGYSTQGWAIDRQNLFWSIDRSYSYFPVKFGQNLCLDTPL